ERAEGRKEGIEIGFQKGIEKGIEQGEINKTKTIALNLKNMNMSIEDIRKITGLTIKEIEDL
ncbi:ATPase, partial [Brachyspira hampsonii]|nr:ATPase [Brachyspira hampsonii]